MAEKKRKKGRDYIDSLGIYGSRNTIDTRANANDEVTDIVDDEGNINNIAEVLRREQGQTFSRPTPPGQPGLAPLNNTSDPARSITSTRNPPGSLGNLGKTNIPRPSLDPQPMQRSYPGVPETSLPSFVDDSPRFSNVTPLSNFRITPNIKELLAQEESRPDSRYDDLITRVTSRAPGTDPASIEGTPEARLAAAMANTNPAPRSVWKRLGASLLRGASQVQAGDAPETMLGKLIGNVIPGLVPSVDSRVQYEQNVARAKDRFVTESAIEKSKQARDKAAQDIKESNERIAAGEASRATAANTQRILNQTRLDNVTRQRAENIMEGLSKLPEQDPQRDALAKILAEPPYSIPVGRNYGLLSTEEKQRQREATEEAKSNKPLTEGDLKRKAEATVKASYNPEEKARASTDARLDQIKQSVRDSEFGGKITTANRDEYNKRWKAEYDRILQSNKSFSQAEYDKLLKAEMDRLRSGEASNTASTRQPIRSKGKVQASNTARGTDYRGVTIKLPGARK